MIDDILYIAGALFFPLLLLLLLTETLVQKRRYRLTVPPRWTSNTLLALSNIGLGKLAAPLGGAVIAAVLANRGIGLLNMGPLPSWLAVVLGVLMLDLIGYFQHRMMHGIPLLWRLHLVHHSDRDVDVTTHFRHHPLEAALGIAVQLLILSVVGPRPEAVVLFHTLHSMCGAFNHANIRMPAFLDLAVRQVIVTPDMHRVHHSSWQPETDSNFGGLFAFWDRIFGTYVHEPAGGHEGVTLGVGAFESERDQWPDRVFMQPFRWHKSRERASSGITCLRPEGRQPAGAVREQEIATG